MAASAAYFHVNMQSVVRGFHVYQAVWTPVVNSEHVTQQEHGNTEDNYAVAILNGGVVVGHTFWHFIGRGGEITIGNSPLPLHPASQELGAWAGSSAHCTASAQLNGF